MNASLNPNRVAHHNTHVPIRIAALLGDPSGIGPEVMVRLLAHNSVRTDVSVVLIGAPDVLAAGEKVAGSTLGVKLIASVDEPLAAGEIGFLARCDISSDQIVLGQSNAISGIAALRALETAADAAMAGAVQGICFAPLNKHSLRLAGMHAEDEMRHLQTRMGVNDFVCEFNVTQNLWTSRVTSHIPLREVADAITLEGIGDAVRIIDKSLRAAGVANPRIGVCGLNPHAGDGGSIGREEIDLIAPAVEAVKRQGIAVTGPHSADTIFVAARKGAFDGIVTLYHDQGQIAMKLMGFESGITVLGGLPVPVCTCASGSAFDIAGKGIARADGLREAFTTCVRMANAGVRAG
jgi:4-hydroxythreonine-4-phosphate dehydrogenase